MTRIGLTGGIGSGKTTVAEVFKTLGIPVFLADEEARRIQNEVETVKNKIQQVLGDVYDINGTLNRKRVAELVFVFAKQRYCSNRVRTKIWMP